MNGKFRVGLKLLMIFMVCFVVMVIMVMVFFSCLYILRVLILKKENCYYYQLLKMKNIDENLISFSLYLFI